jgi:chromosomal replication initiation ATPase DnaA
MGWEPDPAPRAADGAASQDEIAASLLTTIVSSAFAVPVAELHRPNRGGKTTAFARQVAIYLSHTRLGLTYTAAGALFGRDRTTAAYACRTIEERREDAGVDAIVDCVERAIDRLPGLARPDGGAA